MKGWVQPQSSLVAGISDEVVHSSNEWGITLTSASETQEDDKPKGAEGSRVKQSISLLSNSFFFFPSIFQASILNTAGNRLLLMYFFNGTNIFIFIFS